MKRNARRAFTALKNLGAPVYAHGGDYGAHFIISAEENHSEIWADDYNARALESIDPNTGEILWQAGVNPKITRILKTNSLMFEWINPGMIGVYDA